MRVHWLQHVAHEDLGCIAPWLAARGLQPTCTCLWAGEALPEVEDFDVLIVMGGPMNVDQHTEYPWLVPEKQLIAAAITAGRRVLGICLGSQLIARALGAAVTRNAHTEIGWFEIRLNTQGRRLDWLADWPGAVTAFHWHGDTFAIPDGASLLMSSEACAHQAFAWNGRVLGLQFHLEVTAADARRWLGVEQPAAERYVQTAEAILSRLDAFAFNNQLMGRLLERFLFPAA